MRIGRVLGVAAVWLVLMGPMLAGLAVAANGRRPIYGPTNITEPGSYILTRDVGEPGTFQTIIIAANNVDIDFNGFTVRGSDPVIWASNVRGVTIHDGFLIHDDAGIFFASVNDFVIRRLVVSGTGENGIIAYGSNGVIEDNVINSSAGISAIGTNLTIRGNRITGGFAPLRLSGSGNMLLGNLVSGSTFDGIWVSGANTLVEGNVVTSCGGFGLHFDTGSSGIVHGGNVARGNTGTASGCSATNTNFCDQGTGNTSRGDNYLPNQM